MKTLNKKNYCTTAFTMIEVLVVCAVIALLATLILPSLTRSKEYAKQIECMNNMRNVALAHKTYMNDNNGSMPVSKYWIDDFRLVYNYVRKQKEVFLCPTAHKDPDVVFTAKGYLRNGDFVTSGNVEDVEKNNNYNNGKGNNPYHFDPSNPSPTTQAVIAAKKDARVILEKYWDCHFNGRVFNVIYIDDMHYEKEVTGMAEYWTLDDRGWIDTSLDPHPATASYKTAVLVEDDTKDEDLTGGGAGSGLGDCPFCGGDGVKDNGHSCNHCGGDGWL